MKYFHIEPEVAGGYGPNTLLDRSVQPFVIVRLHYKFDGWEGDVLLEGHRCWLITEDAKKEIESCGLTGVSYGEVEVTTSSLFRELYPTQKLPKFVRLMPEGIAGEDDFGIIFGHTLVVSERALKLLRGLGLAHADIELFTK
jgi:hypothetical protein